MDFYGIFSQGPEQLDFFVNKIYNPKIIEKLACIVLTLTHFYVTHSKNTWQS